ESPAYRAQQHPFRVGAGNGEIGTSGLTSFAGSNPVLEVSGRTLQHFRGPPMPDLPGTRKQGVALAPVTGAKIALRADEYLVDAPHVVLRKAMRRFEHPRRAPFIPVDGDGRHFA